MLKHAMTHDPADPRAPYYLGNLLYDVQQRAAIRAWEQARELDPAFARVHRNLAFAYAHSEKDNRKAIASMEKAVECDPADPRFFLELDVLYAAANAPHSKRLALLEKHHQTVARRDDTLLRQAVLYNLTREYEKAIALLENRHFHIWEGGENSAHDVYVDAHVMRGRKLMREGKVREAVADFEKAALYPERFELGEPYDGGRGAEVQYLRGLAHERLGDSATARRCFEEATAKDRRGTPLGYYQGLALLKLGRGAEAAALFEDLVRTGREILTADDGAYFFEKFGTKEIGAAQKAHGHYLVGLGLVGGGAKEEGRGELKRALEVNTSILGAAAALADTAEGE